MLLLGYTNKDFHNLIVTYRECNKVVHIACGLFAERCPDKPLVTKDI